MSRLVLLNGLPLSFGGPCYICHIFAVFPISPETLRKIANEASEVVCFVRHNSTLNYLNSLLGVNLTPSNDKYYFMHNSNDIVVVAIAKNYNRDGGEVNEPEIELFEIDYYDGPDALNI